MKRYGPPSGVGKTLKFSSTKGCQTSNYEKPTWAYVGNFDIPTYTSLFFYVLFHTNIYILGLILCWCRYQCGYEPNMMIQTTLGLSREVSYPH
jgi:hypothetical protein